MKSFVLLFARLKQYYRSSKAIFCIFILGSLLLNLLMIFLYGNTVSYMLSKNTNTPYYCKYKVNLGGAAYQDLCKQLDSILQGKKIKDITFHSVFGEEEEIVFLTSSKNNDAGLEWKKLKGRIYFTPEEIENRKKCLIVPRDCGLKPGDKTVNSLGEFEIVGVGTFIQVGYIPITLFEALQLPVSYVDILLTERLTMEAHQQFMNTLDHVYGPENTIPASGVSQDLKDFHKNILENFILYVFTSAAFLFLLQYITAVNIKTDAISELVGATKGKVAFYLLLERFCITLVTAAGSVVIHRVFYDSFFERFNLTSIDYAWEDYGIIVGILVSASLIASIPHVVSYARKSALRVFTE